MSIKVMSAAKGLPQKRRREILERDGYACQLCGEARPRWLRIDHKIPQVLGGDDSDDNLWVLCLWCNGKKGSKTMPFQLRFHSGQCGRCGRYTHRSGDCEGSDTWKATHEH